MRITIGLKVIGKWVKISLGTDTDLSDTVKEHNLGYSLFEALTHMFGRAKHQDGLQKTIIQINGEPSNVSETFFRIKKCFEIDHAIEGLQRIEDELKKSKNPDLNKIRYICSSSLRKLLQ